MDSIEEINKKLAEEYGNDLVLNLPKYRLVWTTNQLEKRFGIFRVFTETGIFLREECEVKEVRKYPFSYEDMWVLEAIMSTTGNPYLEMVTSWSYEPVWIFGAANSDRQPIWRAVRLLVRNHIYGDPNARTRSPSELEDEEASRMQKEKATFKEMLKEGTDTDATNYFK